MPNVVTTMTNDDPLTISRYVMPTLPLHPAALDAPYPVLATAP
jgi:hypothetical protein